MWKLLVKTRAFFLVWLIVTVLVHTSKDYGLLQPFEWMIFDTFMQLRPQEPVDRRIVIVALTEQDIANLNEYPVSDRKLAAVLNKIKQQKPRVIGLDFFRDVPVAKGRADLLKVFETTPNLIGIQKVDPGAPVAPPPVLKESERVGTVDTLSDGDRKLRRTLLYPMADGSENVPNLGLALARKYLEKQGIEQQTAPDGSSFQFKKTVFVPLEENDGGYSRTDASNYQILTNYRGPAGSFTTVSFSDVLNNNVNKVSPTLMKDRIVLVGATAESVKDLFSTPYSKDLESGPQVTSGVEINANIASQIVASVLDERPLFRFLSEEVEYAGTFFITVLTLFLIWNAKPTITKELSVNFIVKLFFIIVTFTGVIVGITYYAFLNSFWLPVFLPVFYLTTSSATLAGYIYIERIKNINILLEQKNKILQNTQSELLTSNEVLQKKTLALQESESKLILALDAASSAVWDLDLVEQELYILNNCRRLFAWDNDSSRMSFDDFLERVVDDEGSLIKTISSIIDDAKECNFEFQVTLDSGIQHWLTVKGKVYYNSGSSQATRILGILSDITESKYYEEKIGYNKRVQKILSENSFDIEMLLDKNLDIRYVSPAIKRILGYTTKDVYYLLNFVNFIHPEDLDSFHSSIESISEVSGSVVHTEYRFLHKDGSWRMLESAICYYSEEPALNSFVANSRDIFVVNLRDITDYWQIQKAFNNVEN